MDKHQNSQLLKQDNSMKEPFLDKLTQESLVINKTEEPAHGHGHAAPPAVRTGLAKLFGDNYITFSILTALFFGTYNFLIDTAMQGQMPTLRIMYLTGVFPIIYYLAYHITQAVQLNKKKGKFWTRSDSAYIKENGSIDWYLIRLVFGRFLCTLTLVGQVYYTFSSSIKSGISSAIITSLYAGNVLTTSLAFYLIFGEKLTQKHLVGMIFIVISIIMISYGKDSQIDSSLTNKYTLSVWVPIGMAFLGCFLFTTQSLISRAVRATKISSLQYTADSIVLSSLITTSLALFEHLAVQPYTLQEALYVLSASAVWILGVLCLNGAITYGKAGPVQALAQLQSPSQLIMEISIFTRIPTLYGVSGMLLSIIGALIIILSKK
ncbi:UNKNOWN [Stylonychia lemnae]|uniref:EamA domain-containing protein n=1 Tax=Stylonychia lemnae TaxID=5949 RepID=A0A077ZPC7_STYLE|nr:UNKNOWN [Stylonychia lemnae]|eukprot:CDW71778.1 UNKNOWN [Stylonychia lemnae]